MSDPKQPQNWGPSVSYNRQILVAGTDNIAEIEIGRKFDGATVTAVKFCNQGTNSSVQVGREGNFETIPRTNAMEVSFGEGFPLHIEDKFKVVFTATGATPVHKVIVIMTVVNFNC